MSLSRQKQSSGGILSKRYSLSLSKQFQGPNESFIHNESFYYVRCELLWLETSSCWKIIITVSTEFLESQYKTFSKIFEFSIITDLLAFTCFLTGFNNQHYGIRRECLPFTWRLLPDVFCFSIPYFLCFVSKWLATKKEPPNYS